MRFYPWILLVSLLFSCGNSTEDNNLEIQKAVEAFNIENYSQALLRLNKLLKQDPNNASALLLKGRCLFNSNEQEEGLNYTSKAIAAKSDFYEAHAFRAIMYSQGRNYTKAQEDIEIALKGDPENLDYLSEYGVIQQQLDKHEEAIETFSKILEKESRYESVYYFRGLSLDKLGRSEEAIDNFNAAILINPNIYDFRSSRAFTYMKLKNYDAAFEDFNACLVLAKSANNFQNEAIGFNNRGFVYYKRGELGKALQDINYSIKNFDKNPYAYKNRGLVYIAQNQNELACPDFQKAIDLGYSQLYGTEVQDLLDQHCK